MSVVAPYVWRHPDGRAIEVYPLRKVHSKPHTPVWYTYRKSETAKEWYASPPGTEWTGCSYNDLPPNENIPIQR